MIKTEMVSYTALGQRDESLSLAMVEARQKVLGPAQTRHSCPVARTVEDAFLVDESTLLSDISNTKRFYFTVDRTHKSRG
jgi:hypothetical protein